MLTRSLTATSSVDVRCSAWTIPVAVIPATFKLPVVDRFSSPKEMAVDESVMEPPLSVRVQTTALVPIVAGASIY